MKKTILSLVVILAGNSAFASSPLFGALACGLIEGKRYSEYNDWCYSNGAKITSATVVDALVNGEISASDAKQILAELEKQAAAEPEKGQ